MEVHGAAYLYTLAGLMVTFAGFSALLWGLRQAAGARLSPLDRFIAKTVMTYLLVLTAGALLPPLLALFVVFGSAVTLVMPGYILAGLPSGAAVYITTLTVNFLIVAFSFLTALNIIMEQPVKAPSKHKKFGNYALGKPTEVLPSKKITSPSERGG